MISLTKSLALDYAPHDIRVNAICPGFVWSRPWERLTGGLKRTVPAFTSGSSRRSWRATLPGTSPASGSQWTGASRCGRRSEAGNE
jgi:NAD(P)-dependent dehydrogenase (short-subunit alcohol dehydrogenase family)